jgi:uncharacterized protein (TIGR03435 family)
MRLVLIAASLTAAGALAYAQRPSPQFEVVSIKRHVGTDLSARGSRTLPDGTTMITNMPISVLFWSRVTSVPARDIIGVPDWARVERYDIAAKGPAGASRDQQRAMWRAMLADRMKLVAHEEQRERDAFALVLRRADGRLGPQLMPSTLDCDSAPTISSAPGRPLTLQDFQKRCGIGGAGPTVASGSATMDQLARFLSGQADGEVEDRTGLTGRYAFTLTFSRQRLTIPQNDSTPADDTADLFTAVQEQLGLKLQHEKKMTTVFVIDHIERPTEN